MATAICANPACQQPFDARPYRMNRSAHLHCSHACQNITKRHLLDQRTHKHCGHCKENLPLNVYGFHKTGEKAGLPLSRCKICTNKISKEYTQKHPVQARERKAKWNEANIENWHKANPEKHKEYRRRRRALKANAPINDFTAAQWTEMQAAYGHRCAYCGKRCKGRLTQDHIAALSAGGSHTLSNIVPACQSCNSRKRTGPPLIPIQPLLFTLAPAKHQKGNL